MTGPRRPRLAIALVAAAVGWPLLLASAVWPDPSPLGPAWRPLVYLVGSRICHQRPERSFATAGVRWPVCGRCSGIYLAAPAGAIAARLSRRRSRGRSGLTPWLAAAAVPTVATLGAEWLNLAEVTNGARALAGLAIGSVVAFVVVDTAAGGAEPMGYTSRS
jgi:uncharacterized membrane protein